MRPSAFSPAQKIYGIISSDQFKAKMSEEAQIKVIVSGYYEFEPERTVIVAQAGPFGLRPETKSFGQLSLTFGVVCLGSALLFVCGHFYIKTHGQKNERVIKQLQRLAEADSSSIVAAVE